MTRIIRTKNLICYIDDEYECAVFERSNKARYIGQLFNMPKLPMTLMIEWDQIAELVYAEFVGQ